MIPTTAEPLDRSYISGDTPLEITDVNAGNVDREGFFCCMSGRETEGYQHKLGWIKARFCEGLKLKMISRGGPRIHRVHSRTIWLVRRGRSRLHVDPLHLDCGQSQTPRLRPGHCSIAVLTMPKLKA